MNTISLKDAHFLYVEDDPSNRYVMSLLMEKRSGRKTWSSLKTALILWRG